MYNVAFVMFVCLNWKIINGLSLTIGRSSNADYVVGNDPNADTYYLVQMALANITSNRGGVLSFEEGLYLFSSNLRIPSNVSIVGSGINKTILKLANGEKSFNKSAFIYTTNASSITIQGVTLDGNRHNNIVNGIFGSNVSGLTINEVQIHDFLANGISLTGAYKSAILNSYVRDVAWVGISVFSSNAISLKNNVVERSGNHGFFVRNSFDVEFDTNTFNSNGNDSDGCGITFQSSNLTSTNSVVTVSKKVGVCISSSNIILSNYNINSVSKDIRCVAVANDTISFSYTNIICNGKLYGPKVHPRKNTWKAKIIKIVIPSVIGIIVIVCVAQLIVMYRNHCKVRREATAAASTNTVTETA